jgi:hypothetical protein
MDIPVLHSRDTHVDCTEDNILENCNCYQVESSLGKSKIPLYTEQRKVLFERCS